MFLIAAWLLVGGLDLRFTWSRVPLWLQGFAGITAAVSLWAVYRLMLQNSYLAPTVYVQRERGHAVVSSGAYGIVRHPFYGALIPFFFGGSLLLGSWLSAVVSALIALLLAFRCVREERHLSQELEGYTDYMQQVPSRLIPHVW
jgi:protein-S-isoprenylcysteine O-methyltransferase Ste14